MHRNTAVGTILLVLCASAMLGCASRQTPENFNQAEVGAARNVEWGTVQAVRAVTIQNDARGVTRVVPSAVRGSRSGIEITVLLESGRNIAVVQDGTLEAFREGDRVQVATDGSTTRVTR